MSTQRMLATVTQRNRPSNNLHLCEGGTGNYKPNTGTAAVNGASLAAVAASRVGLHRRGSGLCRYSATTTLSRSVT